MTEARSQIWNLQFRISLISSELIELNEYKSVLSNRLLLRLRRSGVTTEMFEAAQTRPMAARMASIKACQCTRRLTSRNRSIA